MSPSRALHDLLWPYYRDFLWVKRRIYFLREFVQVLDRASHGKPFRIRNDVVWVSAADVHTACINDLWSLTKSMRHGIQSKDPKHQYSPRSQFMRKRGLFIEIRDHHLSSFSRQYVPHAGDDEDMVEKYEKETPELFAELFPGCTGDTPTADDVEDLCERVRIETYDLGQDRNKNRAHRFEGDFGKAKALSVDDVSAVFEYCENLFQDLAVLGAALNYPADNWFRADLAATATDLADQLLFGGIAEAECLRGTRTRDELFARLHEIDDAREHDTPYFNDRQHTPEFGMLPT